MEPRSYLQLLPPEVKATIKERAERSVYVEAVIINPTGKLYYGSRYWIIIEQYMLSPLTGKRLPMYYKDFFSSREIKQIVTHIGSGNPHIFMRRPNESGSIDGPVDVGVYILIDEGGNVEVGLDDPPGIENVTIYFEKSVFLRIFENLYEMVQRIEGREEDSDLAYVTLFVDGSIIQSKGGFGKILENL